MEPDFDLIVVMVLMVFGEFPCVTRLRTAPTTWCIFTTPVFVLIDVRPCAGNISTPGTISPALRLRCSVKTRCMVFITIRKGHCFTCGQRFAFKTGAAPFASSSFADSSHARVYFRSALGAFAWIFVSHIILLVIG